MAKLALLALAFAAVVVFSEVSAYRTTITTTTIEDIDFTNTRGSQSPQQCQRQIQLQQLDHCQMHLNQGTSVLRIPIPQLDQPHLQLCCNQLRNVQTQCQCEAIQQVFDEARQQGGQLEMLQKLSKAQSLPKDCNLQVQDCPIRSPRV